MEILSVDSFRRNLLAEGDDLRGVKADALGVSLLREDLSWLDDDTLTLLIEERDDWRESIDSNEALLNRSGAFVSEPFILNILSSTIERNRHELH